MSGRSVEGYSPYEDSLTAKVQGKLMQYFDIMNEGKRQSQKDKEIIQGLVSDISHQVKTPVANIKMFTGILQRHELTPEKQTEFLGMMEGQINKLDFLMQSLIKMSRLETGTFTIHMEEAELSDTIARALSAVWVKAEKKGIRISADCGSSLHVRHDPKWTAEPLFRYFFSAEGRITGMSLSQPEKIIGQGKKMDIVTVHNLKKYFGRGENQVKALDGISFSIEKGKFTAIIGASGSGKTTLLNMIGGLDVPDEGEVSVDGVKLSGLKESELAVFRRSKVGMIYQNFNLIPTLTVKENILFSLSLAGSAPDQVFLEEILELLRLKDRLNAYPGELSGGGQQRIAIARALIAKPSVLLADEPTGNLDSKTGQNVLGLLKLSADTYRQTLVMITHNLELAQTADRVIRIEDGRVCG